MPDSGTDTGSVRATARSGAKNNATSTTTPRPEAARDRRGLAKVRVP